MSGTLRSLRTTATAEVSNLEQGMKRAAAATRQVGAAAEESSRRGSRAMDDLGRRGGVSLGVVAKGGREAAMGLLQLGDVAGATSSKVGGLLSGMVSGFAGGGLIGLGIGAVTGAIALLGVESERTRQEQEKLAKEQEKAADKAREQAEKARDAAEQKAKELQQLRDEIDLLNARTEAERRGVENRISMRKATEKGPEHAALEEEREAAEAARRRREADDKAAEDSAQRVRRQAEERAELERRAAEAQKEMVRQLEEQARREFDVLTLTTEQLRAKQQQKLIQDLINAGRKEEAEAIRQAVEYEKQMKAREENGKKAKDAAEEQQREQEKQEASRKRLSDAVDEEIQKLRDERALLAAGTEELRKREERRQREIELVKQYGAEAGKVIEEQRRFWAEEDARAAKQKTDAAKTAKAKAHRESAGVGTDRIDEATGEYSDTALADARKARRDATRQQKRARAAKGRRMGRSIHDGRFSGLGGIRSGRRIDQRGPFSDWYGGAGDMGVHEDDGGPVTPGMREPKKKPGEGDDAPKPPTYPTHPPAITEGDKGAPKDGRGDDAAKALGDAATSSKAAADTLGQIAPQAKEAADGAKKTADAATELKAPVDELATGLTSAAEGIGQVKASVTEAVTGVTKVVKAVNDLQTEMARLKSALDQLQKAA